MKALKVLGLLLAGLVAVVLFGRFFLSQLGTQRAPELAGVVATAPPGFAVTDAGKVAPERAAALLAAQAAAGGKEGVRFEDNGASVLWLADPAADEIEERRSGASGTRLQTVWRGGALARLRWAETHGTLDAPGLAPGERTNLYH
jgi:hypothetical protein